MREQVLATAKEMLRKGLVEGTAGNISARMPDGSICITPSSIDYEAMTLDDLERLLRGERPRHIVNPEVLSR